MPKIRPTPILRAVTLSVPVHLLLYFFSPIDAIVIMPALGIEISPHGLVKDRVLAQNDSEKIRRN